MTDPIRELVETALDTYGISVTGDLSTETVSEGTYEVEVPFRGEMIIEDVYSNQGPLLFNKTEYGELSLKGVRDGKLLLIAKPTED